MASFLHAKVQLSVDPHLDTWEFSQGNKGLVFYGANPANRTSTFYALERDNLVCLRQSLPDDSRLFHLRFYSPPHGFTVSALLAL